MAIRVYNYHECSFLGGYFRFHNKGFLFIKNLRIKEFLNFTL